MDMSFFSGDMNKHESDFNVSDKNSSPSKISIIKKNVEDILRCTKCVLPDSYPGIHFNDEGVCNYCVHHSAQKIYGQNALEELLDKYRKNNGDYDFSNIVTDAWNAVPGGTSCDVFDQYVCLYS